MDAFAKCVMVQAYMAKSMAELVLYGWADDFKLQRLEDIPHRLAMCKNIQPAELTEDQCDLLGFRRWSEDSPLRLIPLWLYPWLAEEICTTCIDGSTVIRKADMDTDHTGGWIAYGIIPKQEQEK